MHYMKGGTASVYKKCTDLYTHTHTHTHTVLNYGEHTFITESKLEIVVHSAMEDLAISSSCNPYRRSSCHKELAQGGGGRYGGGGVVGVVEVGEDHGGGDGHLQSSHQFMTLHTALTSIMTD